MSQVEYIMVMCALTLALALAQALRGLSELITSPTRCIPQILWLIVMTGLMVQGWWADGDYNAIGDWTFTAYFLALLSYAIPFFRFHLLVPATRSANFGWGVCAKREVANYSATRIPCHPDCKSANYPIEYWRTDGELA